jgi:inosine-uridine nucleoside N-ribohydrolase
MRKAIVLALLFGVLATTARAQRTPVVLLTDIGMDIDDQWALAHLATSPLVELRGIVTSHAANLPEPASAVTARAARAELEVLHLGRHVPVLAGAPGPMPRGRIPRGTTGSAFLRQQVHGLRAGEKLVVLLIGPATDLASALLEEPALAGRIRVIAMGFKHVGTGGNSWNVRQDVRAWQVVVESPCPVTIGCDDICVRDLALTVPQAKELFLRHGPVAQHLVEIFERNLATQGEAEARRLSGRPDAWPVWDEVVAATLLGATTQHDYPRAVVNDAQLFDFQHPIRGGSISWVTRVDAPRVWADLARCLDQRER